MLNTVILMHKAKLYKFWQGLGFIINEAKKHPDVFMPFFVHVGDVDFTSEKFKNLLLDTYLDDAFKDYVYKYIDSLGMLFLIDNLITIDCAEEHITVHITKA